MNLRIVLLVLLSPTLTCQAQVKQVMDTVSIGTERIIVYDDHTWEEYDVFQRYGQHWVNDHIFAYKEIPFSEIPKETEIYLAEKISDFSIPVEGKLSSSFGLRYGKHHNGVDIPAPEGTPIVAAFEGKVRYARFNNGGYGNMVIIRHKNGLETWYAHLSQIFTETNQMVKPGEVIGFSGNTGRSRGDHLHFECRYLDQSFDPECIFNFQTGELKFKSFVLEKAFLNINSRASDELSEVDWSSDSTMVDSQEATTLLYSNQENQTPATYVVQPGDLLGRIAKRFNLSIDDICRLNNISPDAILPINFPLKLKSEALR